ncbi:type IV pilin protein [Roseateles sp. DXS20W]|uniref:Type IV pilin protein n=1 Tax=Pelomonas lactea TaxID=3299030 RepID=A0ABW7GGV1_9BURK
MSPSASRHSRGFTLMELMIAVVVAGILAAVAYPSYTSFIARGRRADAMAALTSVVQAQERYRSNRTTYASSTGSGGLDMERQLAAVSKYYDVSLEGIGESLSFTNGYVAVAKPKRGSPQDGDKNCQILRVKLEGAIFKYMSADGSDNDTTATENCWGR